MATTHDPKFVPSSDALAVVGLSVSRVKTDTEIFKFLAEADEKIDTLDSQKSVAIYILKMRGWSNANIAKRTNYAERTIVRKYIEGMAVLRTQETTRTIAAVRSADLTEKTVQECTKGTGDSESKIQALERAALTKEVTTKFVTDDGKAPSKQVIDRIIDETAKIVSAQSEPATAGTFIDAIPQVTEAVGITAKTRSSNSEGGKNNPMGVEFHIKAALKDANAIADANGSDYVPTPADVKQVLTLCQFLGLDLILEPEVAAAVEALA
jgi:hypothetical protein